jgi:serine/threonine protein kinase
MNHSLSDEIELKVNDSKYKFIKKLGVAKKLVMDTNTNEFYIQIVKEFLEGEGILAEMLREIIIVKKLDHPNIEKIHDLLIEDDKLTVYYEYTDKNLNDYINNLKMNINTNTLMKIKTVMYQILVAVNHLHSRNIIHRNLSSCRIKIDLTNSKIKISDFFYSRVYRLPLRPYTKDIGTTWYMAPEIILGLDKYSIGVDIWSIGVIFTNFFIKNCIFMGTCRLETLFEIFEVLGTPNDGNLPGFRYFSNLDVELPNTQGCGLRTKIRKLEVIPMPDDAFDLIEQMLCYDPCLRISAKEALKHVSWRYLFLGFF